MSEREKRVKNFIRPSRILTALVITILAVQFASVAFVKANVPIPIGTTAQAEPFESNPTNNVVVGTGVANAPNGYNGNLDNGGTIAYGITGSVTFTTFDAPGSPVTSLDIKMSYKATNAPPNNDRYRIIAWTGGATAPAAANFIMLQDWTNYGEYIYVDADLSGTVTVGDTRRTIVGVFAVNTAVAAGNRDIGKTLVAFNRDENHTGTKPYASAQNVYRDVDLSGTVTVNDIRLHLPTAVGENGVGTTVIAGDPDLNAALVAFNANEKHAEDWDINGKYDFKDPTFALSTSAQAQRTWNNVAEPLTGMWESGDFGAAGLKVRIEAAVIGANNGNILTFYEVWLTIHFGPVPPASSITIQPQSLITLPTNTLFFVDVIATNLDHAWGFTVIIYFDPSVIRALDKVSGHEYFPYDPINSKFTALIDNVNGLVAVTFNSFFGDGRGFTGDTTLIRFYFRTRGGTTALTLDKVKTKIVNTKGGDITPPTMLDGMVQIPSSIFMSAENPPGTPVILPSPILPLGTNWHELFPHYSHRWVVTGWADQGDGYLSASDQLGMTNATGWTYQFHVDQVTTTIHWTFKPNGATMDPTYTGVAEPTVPSDTLPVNPIGTTWHQIYPVYSRPFTITSWIDNGDGHFDPSDQFDFTYTDVTPDVVLGGSEPITFAPLTPPNATNLFYDADSSGTWDAGEPAINDFDGDYTYYSSMGDVVLLGTAPEEGSALSLPGVYDTFYDQNANTLWDVGESAIGDYDGSTTYTPATFFAHLDAVSTDIVLTQKPIPPEPPVPEFPLGIGIALALAPLALIGYMWRLRKTKTKTKQVNLYLKGMKP